MAKEMNSENIIDVLKDADWSGRVSETYTGAELIYDLRLAYIKAFGDKGNMLFGKALINVATSFPQFEDVNKDPEAFLTAIRCASLTACDCNILYASDPSGDTVSFVSSEEMAEAWVRDAGWLNSVEFKDDTGINIFDHIGKFFAFVNNRMYDHYTGGNIKVLDSKDG